MITAKTKLEIVQKIGYAIATLEAYNSVTYSQVEQAMKGLKEAADNLVKEEQ